MASIAAVLRGRAKNELVGEEYANRARSLKVQRAMIAGLALALVLACVLGLVAAAQWRSARNDATIAEARSLAAQSTNQLDTRFDLAQLLAVRAYRQHPSRGAGRRSSRR